MFSWLFGGKKKKKASKARLSKPAASNKGKGTPSQKKGHATYEGIDSVPIVPEKEGSRKERSEQVVEKMGGAEAIASIIKTMLEEDRHRKK